jgi:hypothetical protein
MADTRGLDWPAGSPDRHLGQELTQHVRGPQRTARHSWLVGCLLAEERGWCARCSGRTSNRAERG